MIIIIYFSHGKKCIALSCVYFNYSGPCWIVQYLHQCLLAAKSQKNCSNVSGYFDQTEIDKIMEESLKMKRFQHPHVMGLVGVCLDAGPAPYIIMPYMANGSLQSYLKKERKSLILGEDADEDTVSTHYNKLTVSLSASVGILLQSCVYFYFWKCVGTIVKRQLLLLLKILLLRYTWQPFGAMCYRE